MIHLTKYQIEELAGLIDVRLDTIEDDPQSASGFETIESLGMLRLKVISDFGLYSGEEKEWMIEECKCRIDVAEANKNNEGLKVQGLIQSMQSVIKKLSEHVGFVIIDDGDDSPFLEKDEEVATCPKCGQSTIITEEKEWCGNCCHPIPWPRNKNITN